MLLSIIAITAVAFTCTMIATRQMLLGFPSTIFWAILGGYCYLESATPWDIYYFVFFASMGMAIFSMYAMYALRTSDISGPNDERGKYFDEMKELDLGGPKEVPQGGYLDENKPSARRQALRERASRRRSG